VNLRHISRLKQEEYGHTCKSSLLAPLSSVKLNYKERSSTR
jgi:hypothetical protein